MRDQYNAKQVGVMGNNAGTNATVTQFSQDGKLDSADYNLLLQEISRMRQYVKGDSNMDADSKDIISGNLAEMNNAMKRHDVSTVFDCLKKSGKQLYDIAKSIGCSVLAKYISTMLGF